MLDKITVDNLSDLLKTTLSYKKNNDLETFCHKARYSCERILQIIYEREIGQLPKKILFNTMLQKIGEAMDIIPLEIRKQIESISAVGNPSSHPNQLPEKKQKQLASIAEQSLSHICNWFFNEYLQMDGHEDLFNIQKINFLEAQEKNYRDLITASLSDGILDLEEYEQILDSRKRMNLDDKKAIEIEKEIVLNQFNKNINELSEILTPTDLNSFKKYDIKTHEKPDWVNKGIACLINNNEHHKLKGYLKYYFDEIPNDIVTDVPILLNLLGCWQGWYFQSDSKTYFNLFFIAKSQFDFKGYCIEPVNPNWGLKHKLNEPFLFANIDGILNDEVLFQFNKSMLVKNSWDINYEGVLIEDGQYFEGEWSIRSINGAFNAMKTKSLLPVRIFDTSKLNPIVKTQFLDSYQNLTSSWFVQLQGKTSHFGILHLIDIDIESLYSFHDGLNSFENPFDTQFTIQSNLIVQENDDLTIDYLEGFYEASSKVLLESQYSIQGQYCSKKITFSVDWNSKTISGTIKDDVYKIRSFKGYKI